MGPPSGQDRAAPDDEQAPIVDAAKRAFGRRLSDWVRRKGSLADGIAAISRRVPTKMGAATLSRFLTGSRMPSLGTLCQIAEAMEQDEALPTRSGKYALLEPEVTDTFSHLPWRDEQRSLLDSHGSLSIPHHGVAYRGIMHFLHPGSQQVGARQPGDPPFVGTLVCYSFMPGHSKAVGRATDAGWGMHAGEEVLWVRQGTARMTFRNGTSEKKVDLEEGDIVQVWSDRAKHRIDTSERSTIVTVVSHRPYADLRALSRLESGVATEDVPKPAPTEFEALKLRVAQHISRRRQELRATVPELAEAAGLKPGRIRSYEAGDFQDMPGEHLIKLAGALRVRATQLLGEFSTDRSFHCLKRDEYQWDALIPRKEWEVMRRPHRRLDKVWEPISVETKEPVQLRVVFTQVGTDNDFGEHVGEEISFLLATRQNDRDSDGEIRVNLLNHRDEATLCLLRRDDGAYIQSLTRHQLSPIGSGSKALIMGILWGDER